ncbi:MAG: starch synthase, partial [Paracoccaceae bacterium]
TAGVATGVAFNPIDEIALSQALRRLLDLYADKSAWTSLQKRGMKSDLGWRRAAEKYALVYETVRSR